MQKNPINTLIFLTISISESFIIVKTMGLILLRGETLGGGVDWCTS